MNKTVEEENEGELSFGNIKSALTSVLVASHHPTSARIHYLWNKARRFSKTMGRVIKVWKDIKLYGGSRNHYATVYDWGENIEIAPKPPTSHVLLPTHHFKKFWTLINMLLLLWTASVMPYEICFIDDSSPTWLVINLTIDVLFCIDITVNFCSAYTDREGKLVADRKKIVRNYVTGWFWVDFIGILPFEYLSNIAGYNKLVRFSRMPRMYRLIRIFRLFKMVRLLRSHACLTSIVEFFKLTVGVIRMVKFCLTVLMVVHVIGCFWYYLAKLDDFGIETWIYRYHMVESDNGDIYLASIYYVTQTLATVGFGDIVPFSSTERVFALLLMGVGVGFYSFTISNLSTIMATLDTRSTNFNKKTTALNEFSKATKLPDLLKKKIKDHINHNHQENVYSWFDKDELLKELPASLRREISIHMHKKLVEKINFFQDKDPQFISYVVPKLKNVRMVASEVVFKEGDYAEEIFFMVKGKVSLKTAYGHVFKSYLQGSYFGEVEVLFNKLRQETVQVASVNAEFLVISRRDFLNVIKEFPNISTEIKETAKLREMKNHVNKLHVMNQNKAKPKRTLKRSNTLIPQNKKASKASSDVFWSEYSKSISGNYLPPDIYIGPSLWENKARHSTLPRINAYINRSLPRISRKFESSASDLTLAQNPTISSIVFSPAQFDLRKDKIKSTNKNLDLEFVEVSPNMSFGDSRGDDTEGFDIRASLVMLNQSETEAEALLQKAVDALKEMENKQRIICSKVACFLQERNM